MLKRSVLIASSIAALFCLEQQASAVVTYSYHNGYGLTDHVDVSNSLASDLWWANEFTAVAGGEVVTHVRLAFGQFLTVGTPVSVLVYDDLDDDGDPDNLSLVMRMDTTIGVLHNTGDPSSAQLFDIPDTGVNGRFFVGGMLLSAPANAGMRSERTLTQGRSFLALNEGGIPLGSMNPANLSGLDLNPTPINALVGASPGIDFYVEAIGTVPEPVMATAFVASATVLGRRRRPSRVGR